jgi:hypothetical protein
MQYLQSYVARKGASLPVADATALVVDTATLFVEAKENACAVELCVWLIEAAAARGELNADCTDKLLVFSERAPATVRAEVCLAIEPYLPAAAVRSVHMSIGHALLEEHKAAQACKYATLHVQR